jgi:hypothetical protein
MKKNLCLIAGLVVSLNLISLHAQPGPASRPGMGMSGGPGAPTISDAMARLFGKNSTFTANMETLMTSPSQKEPVTMPGKIAYDSGKSRTEMNMSEWKGMSLRPEAIEHMKAMGMDSMVLISQIGSPVIYTVFPGLKAYTESPVRDPGTNESSDFKVETTEMGKETVDGHPCVKKKMVVTDSKDKKHEFMVWSATDLKDFPVKIETLESDNKVTLSFRDVKFAKPDASLFEPPSDYTKYTDQMEMMRQEMMKRMPQGGMGGMPHGQGQ